MRAVLLAGLLAIAPADAQEDRCTCTLGNASYLYLRCPKGAPADPDPCPAVVDGEHPPARLPGEWNPACYEARRMGCFLRRHAASWRITCSLCATERCCSFPNWRNCPACAGEERPAADPLLPQLLEVLGKMRAIGGEAVEMAMSPHYVIVSDIAGLRIATARGGPRMADRHELLHLYLQRAEQARADWTRVFGAPYETRSLIVLVRSERTRRAFAQAEIGNAEQKLRYGAGTNRLAGGLAGNGMFLHGRDDDTLHFHCRHMIGHLCISSYHTPGVYAEHLPQWLYVGAAHWLCKLHPRAGSAAYYCAYEGTAVSGGGANWEYKARRVAAKGPDRDPVARMLQAATPKEADFDLHLRAWSWFDVFTREEREPFVRFVRLLREGREASAAAKQAFGQEPAQVDARWRERVLGKRPDLTATADEQADEAGARERHAIASETDPNLLAGQIRGLERCGSPLTARLLVELVDKRDSDRVREAIALVLSRTQDGTTRAWLHGKGYEGAGELGRATLCRAFGASRDHDAVPLLRGALADPSWLVRANAARSLAALEDEASIRALEKLSVHATAKLRIAAMDALASFGARAAPAVATVALNLQHGAWQVRVTACQALRAIGHREAVTPLIDRLDREGGRVRDEVLRALQALTGMEREWPADIWRRWWTKQERIEALEERMRAELGREGGGDGDDRYARPRRPPPTYYGVRIFAESVGYLLDVSDSMASGFRVSKAWEERLGHPFTATTRIGVCKEELAWSIRNLDPRTRLNLYFFNERVRRWQTVPVAAGAMGEGAISAVENVAPAGETNHYDALRAVLGLEDAGHGWTTAFPDTPDTVFFLTDGRPTTGDMTRGDELLPWFNEHNRFARLRVHVIALGRAGVDLEFLRALAESNGGTFLQLTDRS